MIIYPGETATIEFEVPFASSHLSKAIITFSQNEFTVLKVETTNITPLSTVAPVTSLVTYTLSQSESLRLENYATCKVQINLMSTEGSRLVGSEVYLPVGVQQYRRVIV